MDRTVLYWTVSGNKAASEQKYLRVLAKLYRKKGAYAQENTQIVIFEHHLEESKPFFNCLTLASTILIFN